MSAKLDALLTWAKYNEICLDHVSINLSPFSFDTKADLTVTFNQANESREQFQAVKRAIGNFPEIERPGEQRPELKKTISIAAVGRRFDLLVKWEGAFECKVYYSCSPAKFKSEEAE